MRMPASGQKRGKSAHELCVRLSGTGIPGRRHGIRPCQGLRHGTRRLPGGRRGAEAEPVEIDVGRAGIRPRPDRERPARPDGGQHGDRPHPGKGWRQAFDRPGNPCRRPFAGRILGPGRRRRPATRRRRAAFEAARPVDAEGGPGRRRRHGGPARHRARAGPGGLQGSSPRRGGRRRQRQWRRAGGGERPQGSRRAHHRGGQDQGGQARHAAAGERSLPLPADAARRRRDEGRARDRVAH